MTTPVSQLLRDLPVNALDYHLPSELIATRPVSPRDSARMMVVHLKGPGKAGDVEHRHVRDLPEYLRSTDVLVFNTSAVIPARLIGRRKDTGGRVEGLFLTTIRPGAAHRRSGISHHCASEASTADEASTHQPAEHWTVMLRSNSRLRPGMVLRLMDRNDRDSDATLTLLEKHDEEWIVEVRVEDSDRSDAGATPAILNRIGRTPLPPYILNQRKSHDTESNIGDELDRLWYQTVYADHSCSHSVAAPTAGLHFTPELLDRLRQMGVLRFDVLLHVGVGTFKPVTSETLSGHVMHSESFAIPHETQSFLMNRMTERAAGKSAGRLIAIGTTTVRVLETLATRELDRELKANITQRQEAGRHHPLVGETDLLIAPPYRFGLVEGMLTNFHLPRSTLMALVAAMVGLERLHELYREAIDRRYRFYSYGDAMLILPPD